LLGNPYVKHWRATTWPVSYSLLLDESVIEGMTMKYLIWYVEFPYTMRDVYDKSCDLQICRTTVARRAKVIFRSA